MTNHPNRAKSARTDIHYWILKAGAYGAGARYVGTNRSKARAAAVKLSDDIGSDVEVYENHAGDFNKFGALHVLTYERRSIIDGGARFLRIREQ